MEHSTSKETNFIKRHVTKDQVKDAGMAFTFILLLFAAGTGAKIYLKLAILALLLDMVWTGAYKPFAIFWYTLSEVLGAIMSRVVLSVVFFVVITPMGWIKRLSGGDTLKLRVWKRGADSVFEVRDHLYGPEDLRSPF